MKKHKKPLIVLGIILVVLILLYLFLIAPRMFSKPDFTGLEGYHFAHRGFFDNEAGVPENSLSAFRAAIDSGYGIELDIQLSKDGVPMIFHDASLDRMCGVEGKIWDFTYEELRELSHMGAQVLHEGTIFPVREKNIPLNIRNTNAPEHPGSLIMEKFPDDENDKQFITGITGKKNFSIVTVAKSGMSSEVGFLRKVLEVFEKYSVSIEYVPSGIDSVSVVVSSKAVSDCLYAIMGDLQKSVKPDSINVTDDIAIVAVVGRKMAYKPGMSGRLFAALGESKINIRMISQSCEELNIIAGVSNEDFEKAVRVLYSSFVKK